MTISMNPKVRCSEHGQMKFKEELSSKNSYVFECSCRRAIIFCEVEDKTKSVEETE